jgi:hypothetical protein
MCALDIGAVARLYLHYGSHLQQPQKPQKRFTTVGAGVELGKDLVQVPVRRLRVGRVNRLECREQGFGIEVISVHHQSSGVVTLDLGRRL